MTTFWFREERCSARLLATWLGEKPDGVVEFEVAMHPSGHCWVRHKGESPQAGYHWRQAFLCRRYMADQLPVPLPWYMALIQGTTAIPKAAGKLIDTIGDQIGLFLEPTHIRRKGQAEADVTVAEAKAKGDIAVLKLQNKLVLQDIQDRTEERVRNREAKRQKNVEAIAALAARELPDSVSDDPVDQDWVAQFFNHCQDVSNEQMQTIWARLLAGEVAKPGSFSLRALALVRVMDKDDADTFTRFCSMVWQTPSGLTPIIFEVEKLSSLGGMRVEFTDLVRLDSLGLIRFEGLSGFQIKNDAPVFRLAYYGRHHILSRTQGEPINSVYNIDIGKVLLTEPGRELALICGSSPNEEYRASVVSIYRQHGWEVTEPAG